MRRCCTARVTHIANTSESFLALAKSLSAPKILLRGSIFLQISANSCLRMDSRSLDPNFWRSNCQKVLPAHTSGLGAVQVSKRCAE